MDCPEPKRGLTRLFVLWSPQHFYEWKERGIVAYMNFTQRLAARWLQSFFLFFNHHHHRLQIKNIYIGAA